MLIRTENITKSYNNRIIIDDVSLNINEGNITGLIGINGAGKTTIMKLLSQIIIPDSGNIIFMDEPLCKKSLINIGYMPEEKGLYKNMKVKEYLKYISDLYLLSNTASFINEWMYKLSMEEYYNSYINNLSKGTVQKIQFISTIIHKPRFLILDEPFSGLDPISHEVLERELKTLKEQGTTILLSTHRVEQVESLCDEVMFIHKGKIILNGKTMDIRKSYSEKIFTIIVDDSSLISKEMIVKYNIISVNNNNIQIQFNTSTEIKAFIDYIYSIGSNLIAFNENIPSVKSIFINSIK
jgi:ABC-2 type transport system ATP-binding protein